MFRPSSMNQEDSVLAVALTWLSLKPHLQAAHWMISSVVPVKAPVIRSLRFSALGSPPQLPFGIVLPIPAGGVAAFSSALLGRGSHVERCTAAAQVASDG